jgi:Tfp pilus assembly protein PilV
MIDTYSSTRRVSDRLLSRRSQARLGRMTRSSLIARTTLSARRQLASEAGDTLIEVMISALLVGLIVIATLNGFDVSNRVSQDERAHNQAVVLAAQSQEQLRSDPATTLDTLESAPHSYTQTVGGTKYTITQSAKFVNGKEETVGCTETKSEEGRYVAVTSSVTWAKLEAAKRPAVTQSSIITPPDGSGLEVDVNNGATPPVGIPGVTVFSGGVETTTSEAGCVIYGGIPATTANIEAYKLGYVTPSGERKVIVKEVSIAPNITTHKEIVLAAGGSITADFQYNKKATYTNGSVVETVKGDTFVAYNGEIPVTPEYEMGSTKFAFNPEEEYEALTGTTTVTTPKKAEGYEATAKTVIKAPYYSSGDLFPFTGEKWSVYAGDCTLNNPTKYSIKPGSTLVTAGGNVTVSVPMSYVRLNVYQGMTGSTKETTHQEVKITNVSCTSQTPQQVAVNASKANYEHRQNTNSEGHLEVPFQPFGKFTLCLAYNSGTNHRTYTTSYENTTEKGSEPESLYVGDTSSTKIPKWEVVTPSSGEAKC